MLNKEAQSPLSGGINVIHKALINPLTAPIYQYGMIAPIAQEMIKYKPHETTFHIPFIGGQFGRSTGKFHQALGKGVEFYKDLPHEQRSKIKKVKRYVDEFANLQNVADVAKMVSDYSGIGKNYGEQLAVARRRAERGLSGKYRGYLGELASHYDPNVKLTPTTVGSEFGFAEKYPKNVITPKMQKQLAAIPEFAGNTIKKVANMENNFRKAYSVEKQALIDKCMDYKDEFVLHDQQSKDLLYDRMYNQNTYIVGDTDNLVGFINTGRRKLAGIAEDPLYVRVVYVSPDQGGRGVASQLIKSACEWEEDKGWNISKGLWMQVCQGNTKMEKVASRNGFQVVDVWDFDGKKVNIWYKDK